MTDPYSDLADLNTENTENTENSENSDGGGGSEQTSIVSSAYSMDVDLNSSPAQNDDSDFPVAQPLPANAAAFWPDGSRIWRFVAEGDPRRWQDLEWIDENVEEMTNLGWIEPNPEGVFWTVEEATRIYDAYIEQATAAYREADFGDDAEDFDAGEFAEPAAQYAPEPAAQYAPEPEIPAAPPLPPAAAPPAPAGPQWSRPADADRDGTQYADVMDELRRVVPENDGRWSATQAAEIYGDTQFADEQGITEARARADAAFMSAYSSPDGVVTAEGYNASVDANVEALRAEARADTTSNRYQQSTDFQPTVTAQERMDFIDESAASAREQAASDPQSLGLGMTHAEQTQYMDSQQRLYDAQDFTRLTSEPGREPGSVVRWDGQDFVVDEHGRIPADYDRLEELRAAEQRESEQELLNNPDYQAATAQAERQWEQMRTEPERVEASRLAAEERMRTPTEERLD